MIGVVSHDAGGAEVVSSYLRRHGLGYVATLGGPATRVFARKLGPVVASDLGDTIRRSTWLLCGTSWQSDLEWRAIGLAREAGKRTVAFLDHWVNYRERFERDGETYWPNEIWLGDDRGLDMARKLFDGLDLTLRLVPNPYFADIREELRSAESRLGMRASCGTGRVLFVSEPIAEHALLRFGNERHWGYTELEAVAYFLENASALGVGAERVVLRPHPSESAGKYASFIDAYPGQLLLSDGRGLVDEIAECDVVVGCNSMAMVIGLLARKRVLSCIPPGGDRCVLPQKEIESVCDLLTAAAEGRGR